jgi:protein SCO1/2
MLLTVSPIKSHSDISKAFPDMSNVFEKVSFYDENNKFTKFDGYEDKVLLVFFGYTHCPDVCPTTVLDMARVMKGLGDESSQCIAHIYKRRL